ncbi:MAG TPA: DinB family protein [Actinocrinis sp.]|jgi:uncharacterized damage-inducible protein DinB
MEPITAPQTFASPLGRVRSPTVAPEHEALMGWLDEQRSELLAKLDGLTDEQADRRLVPSLTTLHGLVRHLAKVELIWSVRIVGRSDEPMPFGWPDRVDGDFLLDDGANLQEDVARFVTACERSREVFASVSLDEVRTHPRFGDLSVRWIMVHMVREYAQHNGHADVLRELTDGKSQI